MLAGGILISTFGRGLMGERLRQVVPDLANRGGNWSGGLAPRGDSPATLFGTGLETYPWTWEDFGAPISTAGLDENATLGWFKRTIELALFDPVPDSTIEISQIRMLDLQGHDILSREAPSAGISRTTNT